MRQIRDREMERIMLTPPFATDELMGRDFTRGELEDMRARRATEERPSLFNPLFRRSFFDGQLGRSIFSGEPVAIHQPAVRPVTPSKSAVAVTTLDPGCDEEYRALARELGVYDSQVVNADLERFLADNFIEVYPLESVCKYMDALCEAGRDGWNSRLVWNWHPLRRQDVVTAPEVLQGTVTRGMNTQYRKPVPFPVLETVKTIADRFGEDVRFCVTDVERIPDPFLGVGARTPDGVFKMHVIERWDEPKYRP